jgi:hypothetical protein
LERSEGRIEANFDTVEKIRQVLENAGIEFIGSPNLGVRFWIQSEAAASPPDDGEAAIAPVKTSQAYGRVVG